MRQSDLWLLIYGREKAKVSKEKVSKEIFAEYF